MPEEQPTSTVRLIGLPVPIQVEASAHQDALQREFDLLEVDHTEVPARLRALIEELRGRYEGIGAAAEAALEDAIEHGRDSVDLVYEVPADVAGAAARLSEVLDEVDEYCRSGEHLLTLATPPDLLAYRRWFLGQFIDQLSGRAPTPWEDFVDSGPLVLPAGRQQPAAHRPSATTRAVEEVALPSGWAVEDRSDSVVVRPVGEIDLQTAPQVRDLVQTARREGIERVELDLSGVTFIDSVGLSMIVSAHQRLDADGVGFGVVVPQGLRRLFEISGIDQLVELRH